jgi:hypothetical protein
MSNINNIKTEMLAKLFLTDPVAHYAALLITQDISFEFKSTVWAQMSEKQKEAMRPYLHLAGGEKD